MTESARGRRRRRIRDELLETAGDLLLEVGVEGFSLRELARRTDYTPGALYGYFRDKNALLGELTESIFVHMQEHLSGVPRDLPAPERLARLSDAYVAYAQEHPEAYLLVFTRIPAPGSTSFSGTEPRTPWGPIVDACRDGAFRGELAAQSEDEARIVFFHFFALHHGLAMLRLTRMRELPAQVFEPMSKGVRMSFLRQIAKPDGAPLSGKRQTEA